LIFEEHRKRELFCQTVEKKAMIYLDMTFDEVLMNKRNILRISLNLLLKLTNKIIRLKSFLLLIAWEVSVNF